eukprot:CAMPEP_0114993190 /NCGR_PEP_ID=MMETSP0216-20121206/12384_1 /TAXON_ID=223996 /ORGANISM="Protocruzia adherens, Strain Boccale" /LENGTH=362 /DNA_ID=CAMNT_0002356789 /DNA_START=247 /DNA_END=1335 /DNA_ORIENTATION=-
MTDPGQVPPFWGFHMGDSQEKRKRYCLMCHVFKPDRCHHCSICNRCVLNMDHHCPWINNCVGFHNRKFFLLLLTYTLITCYWIMIVGFSDVYAYRVIFYETGREVHFFPEVFTLITYIIDCALAVLLTIFYKFHLTLVFSNTTTIEHIEAKTKGLSPESKFNIGKRLNWTQVFGKNVWLWPFPMFGQSGKPSGDGIVWPKLQVEMLESVEHSSRDTAGGETIRSEPDSIRVEKSNSTPSQGKNIFNSKGNRFLHAAGRSISPFTSGNPSEESGSHEYSSEASLRYAKFEEQETAEETHRQGSQFGTRLMNKLDTLRDAQPNALDDDDDGTDVDFGNEDDESGHRPSKPKVITDNNLLTPLQG